MKSLTRKAFLIFACASSVALVSSNVRAQAPTNLRIAMSLSDVPRLWGAPDGGFEGVRFGGYMLYDALVEWDLSSRDAPPTLRPALAESWTIDPANPKRWIVKLRETKFHDGSPWNADAAVWNLDSLTNDKAPQYNAGRSGLARTRTLSIASYGKIDDRTIFIETHVPNSYLLHEMSSAFFVSPARYAQVGNDWTKFASNPSGTGPYRFVALAPRASLELEANKDYWNPKRIPKTARTTLYPIPDPNSRVAALRSGQVDLIETLPPDSIESLKAARFQVVTNEYPHSWIWRVSFDAASPMADVRIRKAINLAIDREGLGMLLNGTSKPAKGIALEGTPWFGKPQFVPRYDPAGAKKLLAEAGYGPAKPLTLKVIIASSGGGQMLPLPMNEAIQENLRAVGVDVSFQTVDFIAIINMLRGGARQSGADAINIAMTSQDPSSGILAYESTVAPPRGPNWGFYSNPSLDAAITDARQEFDPARLDEKTAKIHEILVDDAAAIFVVHDLNPRAVSPKVKGFVQARNWYQDYTQISLD